MYQISGMDMRYQVSESVLESHEKRNRRFFRLLRLRGIVDRRSLLTSLHGIPVGAVFEAFGSVLEERNAVAAQKEIAHQEAAAATGDA